MWVCAVVLGVFQASERPVNSDKFRKNWWTFLLCEQHLGAGKQVNKKNHKPPTLPPALLEASFSPLCILVLQSCNFRDGSGYFPTQWVFLLQRSAWTAKWKYYHLFLCHQTTCLHGVWVAKDCSLSLNIQYWQQIKIKVNHPSQFSLLQFISLGCTSKFYFFFLPHFSSLNSTCIFSI